MVEIQQYKTDYKNTVMVYDLKTGNILHRVYFRKYCNFADPVLTLETEILLLAVILLSTIIGVQYAELLFFKKVKYKPKVIPVSMKTGHINC